MRTLCSLPWRSLQVACAIGWFTQPAAAVTTVLTSPAGIPGGTTLHFDGLPEYTVANNLFANQGMSFSRDDGRNVYLLNWAGLGRTTSSPDNVLATILGPGDPSGSWSTHLNLTPTVPLFAVGAYFGNDQGDPDYQFTRLSIYGQTGQLLGFTQATVNNNTSVDQFLGLRSDVPIYRIRFENFISPGNPSTGYSVVLDDLVFAPVPEPTTITLLGTGLLGWWFARQKRRS